MGLPVSEPGPCHGSHPVADRVVGGDRVAGVPMADDRTLTLDEQNEIWMRWQDRETIERLAIEFHTTKEVIRHIISLPRPPG